MFIGTPCIYIYIYIHFACPFVSNKRFDRAQILCETSYKPKVGRIKYIYIYSVTNSISFLLWISIVIPNVKNHNIIMAAWVYFMKRENGCKGVSIMFPQDEQWRRTSLLCLYTAIFCLQSTTICSLNKNKQIVNIADENLTDYTFLCTYHYTKQRIK